MAPVRAAGSRLAKPPLRFTFKDPKIAKSGNGARTGPKPSRKSPPTREVGPSGRNPEAENFTGVKKKRKMNYFLEMMKMKFPLKALIQCPMKNLGEGIPKRMPPRKLLRKELEHLV